ncbi:response regulator transcription factor [Thiohalocapsa marina]|uniref:response regulator transcription factor n=1 Tax=Thiohalocapsa marina TaxID=424902 RepID=UPI001FE5E4C3|nr:response regulator [Thiohalocapsa marina]
MLDDEPDMLKALTRLLRAQGFRAQGFTSARAFLAHERQAGPACLLLDVAMPEIDGLQVQERLRESGAELPIVFLTGHGDIPMSVCALKAGAEDFLTKPVNAADLLRAVKGALQRASDQQVEREEMAALQRRLASLTPREREVLGHVIAGKMNKQIAADLGTGEQNVKVHRGRLMRKMGARSVAELVRMAERLGIPPSG